MKLRFLLILLSLALTAACAASAVQNMQRELAPWKPAAVGAIHLSIPASFAPLERAPLTVFFPSGDAHGLPWIAVAQTPAALGETTAREMLDALTSARDADEVELSPAQATIAGRACDGWAVKDKQARGWVFVLPQGERAIGAIGVAAPAWWPPARAQALRDAILDGVSVDPAVRTE